MSDPLQQDLPILPPWPESRRAMPNVLLRSPLFRVTNHARERTRFKNMELFTHGNAFITYTGEELRQDDADVFLQLLHIARFKYRDPVEEMTVDFRANDMLRVLKRTVNNVSKERLYTSLVRMQANSLCVTGEMGTYNGSMIPEFWTRNDRGEPMAYWRVRLNPRIIGLFSRALYTTIDWDKRLKLDPLAKFLHLQYMSHKKPFPVKISTLYRACGSAASELRYFRADALRAHDQLVSHRIIDSYEYDRERDLISVRRNSLNP